MGEDGRFETKQLMFKVTAGEFIVDCVGTDVLPADVDCTQQTVQKLALALTKDSLKDLKKALRAAMAEVNSVKT